MTERFGKRCVHCKGAGLLFRRDPVTHMHKINSICEACDGVGRDGDAMDQYGKQIQRDEEADREMYEMPKGWESGWL